MLSYKTVTIDTSRITDKTSFQKVLSNAFGVPIWYGCNIDASTQRMFSFAGPADSLSADHAQQCGILVVQLQGMQQFNKRYFHLASEIERLCASVNADMLHAGRPPAMAVAYDWHD